MVTAIQPQLWVNAGSSAVSFYANAFGARTVHIVGAGEDIVAQLAIGDAVFWIATAGPSQERLVPTRWVARPDGCSWSSTILQRCKQVRSPPAQSRSPPSPKSTAGLWGEYSTRTAMNGR